MRKTVPLAIVASFMLLPLPFLELAAAMVPAPTVGVEDSGAHFVEDTELPWFATDMRPPDNPPPGFVMPSSGNAALPAGFEPLDYANMTVTDEQLEGPAGARTTYPLLHNYSMTVSFEWDATLDEFQDMALGLQRFSNLVYDYTDGQFTIGRFELYNNKASWNGANVHVLNKSWYRANAQYGGLFYGGVIQVGRDAWGQRWNSGMGAVTLAHEFGHYGLCVPDEYVEATQEPRCNNNTAGTCIMSDPYSYYEICTDESHDATSTGDPYSCWAYIKYYFPSVVEVHGKPDPGPTTGPGSTVNWHYPDLSLVGAEMSVTPSKANEGDNTTIAITLHNYERLVPGAVEVRFYLDTATPDRLIKSVNVNIGNQDTSVASTPWTAVGGQHTIIAAADPANSVRESNDGNNTASKQVFINNRPRISNSLVGFTSQEDVPLTIKLTSYAIDAEDQPGSLRWSVMKYDNRVLSSIAGQNSLNQTLTFKPVLHWYGTTPVVLAVSDSSNLAAQREVNLTFVFVNYPPHPMDPAVSSASVLRGNAVELISGASDVEDKEEDLDADFAWRPNGSADWKTVEGGFDGTRFVAALRVPMDSGLGPADVRVSFTDTKGNKGPWSYLNASLTVLNNRPSVLDLGLSESSVTRGGLVTFYLNATDQETLSQDLLPEVLFSVNDGDWEPLNVTGEFFDKSWLYQLDIDGSWLPGMYDIKARVRDADGADSVWFELAGALTVYNSLPTVDSAKLTRTRMLRNESSTMTVTGGDYETASGALTVEARVRDSRGRDQNSYVTALVWKNAAWEARFLPPPAAAAGKYVLWVRIGDPDGGWSEWRELTPMVEVGNNLPVAAFYCPATTIQGDTVWFDASNSTDIENHLDVMSFSWDFGDGSSLGTGRTASHAFARPGSFRVTLTLTDKDGASSTAYRTVSVGERPAEAAVTSGGIGLALLGVVLAVAAAGAVGAYLFIKAKKAGAQPASTPVAGKAPSAARARQEQRVDAVPYQAQNAPPTKAPPPG